MINKIIRSKRKTLALEISPRGEVIVRVPKRVSERQIRRFINNSEAWIIKNRAQILAKYKDSQKIYANGEKFLFLGQWQPFEWFAPEPVDDIKSHFEAWYKQKAKDIIPSRVQVLSSLLGYEYGKVKITSARRQWGSCSGVNNLSFAWRLVMAPPECIDYVIIHELVHTMHKHHGIWFWKRVERAVPDYQDHRKWLRDNEHLMNV